MQTAARAAAAIMGMNNIYYRFLHLVEDAEYQTMPARLRMNVIGNPGIDKLDFELLSLAVSAVNGCGLCVTRTSASCAKAASAARRFKARSASHRCCMRSPGCWNTRRLRKADVGRAAPAHSCARAIRASLRSSFSPTAILAGMPPRSTRLSAGVVVVRSTPPGWRFLLLRAFNHWDFPKGMVETGEEPLAAAIREVREETLIADLQFAWGEVYTETGPVQPRQGRALLHRAARKRRR